MADCTPTVPKQQVRVAPVWFCALVTVLTSVEVMCCLTSARTIFDSG